MKFESGGTGPSSFHNDVPRPELNDFANAKGAVDVRNDLEEKTGGFQIRAHGGFVDLLIFVGHRGRGEADAVVIQRSYQAITPELELRARKHFRISHQFAAG